MDQILISPIPEVVLHVRILIIYINIQQQTLKHLWMTFILTDEVPRQELEGLQNTVHPVWDQGEPDILSSRTRFLPLSDLLLHLKDKSLHMTFFLY